MSYDLFFTKPKITEKEFGAFFEDRPKYQIAGAQAVYQNEDTGVYFLFEYQSAGEGDEGEEGAIEAVACLNLNYYRPHVFGLEAMDEIAAFVEHFGFGIHDPQTEGMGDGPFSKEGFLRSWNHGNEFGYFAVLRSDNAPRVVWAMPGERLEAIWKWNREKERIQESFGEDRFVPRIFFMGIGGRAVSVAVWPDAICELIPSVDFLIVGREELAPKPFFGERKPDQIIVPFGELVADLEPHATMDYSLRAYRLPGPVVPEDLRNRIRRLKPTGIAGEGLSVDKVLNEEMVTKVRAAG